MKNLSTARYQDTYCSPGSTGRHYHMGLYIFLCFVLMSFPKLAFAQDVNDIADNILESLDNTPMLISALSYLLALFFGVTGVLKLKNYVEQPAQTAIGASMGRLILAGAFLSIPTFHEVLLTLITGGAENKTHLDDSFSATDWMSELSEKLSKFSKGFTLDFNIILTSIQDSIDSLPRFLNMIGYLFGLLLGFTGMIKLKEHIEDPDRNPMKEAVARLLIGGMFFALPTIYTVIANAFGNGDSSFIGALGSLIDADGFMKSVYSKDKDCYSELVSAPFDAIDSALSDSAPKESLGGAICKSYAHMMALPAFLGFLAKLFGFFFGYLGVVKLRDHLINPQNTPISQVIGRFAAGGAFLSLQTVTSAIRSTVTPDSTQLLSLFKDTTSSYQIDTDCASLNSGGLVSDIVDGIQDALDLGGSDSGKHKPKGMGEDIYCAMTDIVGPMHTAINFFTFVAGTILLMVGISRFLKSEQDGAKAPASLGTLFTFLTAGFLLSFNELVRLLTVTIFSDTTTRVDAEFAFADEVMSGAERAEFYAVIAGILKFMVLIGLISFARGIFIIRNVTEGNNQASMMAGVTHIVAGTLAINLGGFMNMIQKTLGITGIVFS